MLLTSMNGTILVLQLWTIALTSSSKTHRLKPLTWPHLISSRHRHNCLDILDILDCMSKSVLLTCMLDLTLPFHSLPVVHVPQNDGQSQVSSAAKKEEEVPSWLSIFSTPASPHQLFAQVWWNNSIAWWTLPEVLQGRVRYPQSQVDTIQTRKKQKDQQVLPCFSPVVKNYQISGIPALAQRLQQPLLHIGRTLGSGSGW